MDHFFLHFKKVSNAVSVFCPRRFIVRKIKKIVVKISPPNSNGVSNEGGRNFAQFKVSM